MVDEYQDTNTIQERILTLEASARISAWLVMMTRGFIVFAARPFETS